MRVVRLTCDAEPLEVIRKWYCDHPRHLNDMCDFSQICSVDSIGSVHQLKMRDEDPYEHAMYLFYRHRPVLAQLDILGFVTWQVAHERNGHIDLEHDLSDDPKCLSVWESVESTEHCLVDDSKWFWIPINFKRDSVRDDAATMNDVQARLDWYLYDKPLDVSKDGDFVGFMMLGAVMSSMARWNNIPNTLMDIYKMCPRFRERRIALETARLQTQFAHFTETEDRMIALFLHNKMDDILSNDMLCKATPADRQRFYFLWPTRVPPRYSFVVPMENVPHDRFLSVYAGGVVHLSYLDVPQWIIYYSLQIADVQVVLNELVDDGVVRSVAKRIIQYYVQHPEMHRKKLRGNYGNKGTVGFGTKGGVVVEEEEVFNATPSQLESEVPKCMQNIMMARRFPENMERLRMIGVMRNAGLTKEDTHKWFAEKFDKYSDGYPDMTARFSFEAVWAYNEGKSTACGNIINDTLDDKRGVLKCPYVSDVEDVAKSCRSACSPNKPIYGPHSYLEERLKRRAPIVIKQEDEVVAERPLDFSSSSDDPFDDDED